MGKEADGEAQVEPPAAAPYSVFTPREKWYIIAIAAYSTFFSTVSSFIYYPAIHLISESLDTSVERVNLTVTTYLALSTVAPTLFGDVADQLGRRPVYLIMFTLYVVASIAIASIQSFSALLGLRLLQALAISGTFSIASGVLADIARQDERGSYGSAISFASTAAPTLGPILGGAISYAAGWTWIFWFLSIAAGFCLLLIVFLLPETNRKIVGNGSVPPPKVLTLPAPHLFKHWEHSTSDEEFGRKPLKMPNPLRSLKLLFRKDNAVVITACGILYLVYTCINISLSVVCIEIYNLNQWQAGLIYLPFGLGGVAAAFCQGRLMDGAYARARAKSGQTTDKVRGDDLDKYDIEKVRTSIIWYPILLTCVSVVACGWVLHAKVHISVPLILQFIAGFSMQLGFSIYNVLLADKNERNAAAAQAASNIMRGSLSAIMVSFLEQLIKKINIGWVFTLMGGFCLVACGLFAVDHHKGFIWRQQALEAKTSKREGQRASTS